MANGDRLTGEIKQLHRGKLDFKTDATDTIQIKWDHVAQLTSRQQLEVELEDGRKLYGYLISTASGQIEIKTGSGAVDLALASVVRITPIEESVRDRLDGDIELGFSYAKSSDTTQLTVAAEAGYRTRTYLAQTDLSMILSSRQEVERTYRGTMGFRYQRFLPRRWFAVGLGRFQQNRELGLELRTTIGGGAGRYLVQTNSSLVAAFGGISFNREEYSSQTSGKGSTEAIAGFQVSRFSFGDRETDFTVDLTVYPSINDWGRVRAELNARLKYEVVDDLFISLSFYDSFDSEPPATEAEKNDYGLVTSLGWSF
jgi:hypothetical protein